MPVQLSSKETAFARALCARTAGDVFAGSEVRNFDRLKVGDQVEAKFTQAMAGSVELAAKK